MIPFFGYRAGERWWRAGIGFAYVPAIIAVVSVELWMKADAAVIWLSLGIFWLAFVGYVLISDRRLRS